MIFKLRKIYKNKLGKQKLPRVCLGNSRAGIFVSTSPSQPFPEEPCPDPDQYFLGVKAIVS